MQTKEEILGKTPEELKKFVTECGMPPFTSKQILKWIYQKRVYDFNQMTDISKNNREKLQQVATIGINPPAESITSYSVIVGSKPSIVIASPFPV